MVQIAIIGAGMAGLAAASELTRAGLVPTVFEKSRGVGGRVATRRVGGFTVDHGAQVVKSPSAEVYDLVAATGAANDLTAPVWIFDGAGQVSPGDPAFNAEPKWVWPGGNTSIAKHMARGINVHLETTVTALRRVGVGYELIDDGGAATGPFAMVLLTAPAPQAAAILAASDLASAARAELLAALEPVRYRACTSIALAYAQRPELPWYALLNVDRRHPIAWLACEHAKPGRAPAGQALILAHMSTRWSEVYAAALPRGTCGQAEALPAPVVEAHTLTQALVGEDLGALLWADVHHWRYALCDAPYGPAAREGRDGVYLAGDMEAGLGRVHLAIESGWAAAGRIVAGLSHR